VTDEIYPNAQGEAMNVEAQSKWIRRYFARSRRWVIADWIEELGNAIIRLSVWVRNPLCRCKWCVRDHEAIINGCEEHGMEIADLRERLRENLLMCELKGER
jgi:hypothetical protein